MQATTVAVVILNYNGKRFLEKFLAQVISFSAPYDVVVADNASTDDSVSYLNTIFPQLKVLVNSQNDGYARGYNVALQQLEYDYFVLLNNDVEVTANWLKPLISLMDSNSHIAACQPKLLDQNNKHLFEYAGAAGGFIDTYGYPFCKGRLFANLEEDKGQYNVASQIFWASGACMMVRSKALWQVGGLDNDYFAHMEEIDLCWRFKNCGYQIWYEPASKVYHVGGGTLQKVSPHKTYLNFRNSLITLVKVHPSKKLLLKIFVRMILDGVAGVKFMIELKPGHCFAIIKAHFHFYGHIANTLQKRKKLAQLQGYIPTLADAYDGSIVYEHFAKGVKKFSDLNGKFL